MNFNYSGNNHVNVKVDSWLRIAKMQRKGNASPK